MPPRAREGDEKSDSGGKEPAKKRRQRREEGSDTRTRSRGGKTKGSARAESDSVGDRWKSNLGHARRAGRETTERGRGEQNLK